ASRAIDLAGKIESWKAPRLKVGHKFTWIHVIILDRIARLQHYHSFQSRNMLEQFELHLLRQGGADPVRIDRGIIQPLGLQENLVLFTLREADHLVLEGRAIARSDRFDLSRVERRAIQIPPDQLVSLRRAMGDVADHLRGFYPLGQAREGLRRIVSGLDVESIIVNASAIEPRRRACLESAKLEAGPLQGAGETLCGRLTYSTSWNLPGSNMNETSK